MSMECQSYLGCYDFMQQLRLSQVWSVQRGCVRYSPVKPFRGGGRVEADGRTGFTSEITNGVVSDAIVLPLPITMPLCNVPPRQCYGDVRMVRWAALWGRRAADLPVR